MAPPVEPVPAAGAATTTYVVAGNDMSGVKPPQFDWEATDLTRHFKTFRRYCNLVLGTPTYATKSPKEIVNYILLWLGPQGIEIFDTLKFDQPEDEENPERVWDAFLSYFEPKSNFRLARFQLQEITQNPSESTDSFVTKLKVQARKCNFTDNAHLEDTLVDQIIKGTAHENVRRKLLNLDPTKLTLDSALDVARTYEATSTQMQSFNKTIGEIRNRSTKGASSRSKSRNRTNHRNHQDRGKSLQRGDKCMFCGTQPTHPRDQCPARDDDCKSCGKVGHWSRVCQGRDQNSRFDASSRGRQRGRYRGGRGNSHRGHSKGRSYDRRQNVHEMSKEDQQGLPETFDQMSFDSVTIDNINKPVSGQRTEAYATVRIKHKKKQANLRGKVDTGAQGNVLPIRTFRQMFPDRLDTNGLPVNLKSTDIKLTAYNGTEIRQYGQVTIESKYRQGEWITSTFYVAETPGPVIFGIQTSIDMGLVEMHCAVRATPPSECTANSKDIIQSADQLKKLYPDRFEGIGHLPGKYKLTLKPDAKPVIHAPRRAPIQLHDKIKAELHRMTELGVIKPVTQPTDWVSSITYVHKSNGSLRICLDPKDLNNNLKRAQTHIPTVDELTHRFRKAKVFSKLDARAGYWALELDEDSQLLTTFNSPFGRFCFCRLPFGTKVSGDLFNAAMQNVLEGLEGVVSIHDDITVYGEGDTISQATENHDRNLRNLMERARENNLVFNFEKSDILKPEIVFFGNIYGRDGVRPDPQKVAAIRDISPPSSVKELQSFLGMVTYLSPFISNLSELTSPLRTLLQADADFQWHHEHQTAFQAIKNQICSAATLSYFDPSIDTVIQVDASQKSLGAALMQKNRPIAYASKSLSPAESRYANIERELLACVFGAERFHTYVYGKPFLIESDHRPLEMISKKNLTAAPARLQRMLLRLQNYDYTIKYVPGPQMTLPDSLSRLPKTSVDSEIDLNVKVCHVQFSSQRITQLRDETEKDEQLSCLKQIIANGFPESNRDMPRNIVQFWSFRDQLSLDNGLILKGTQIIIPESLRGEYLEKIHQAHQGITRCQQRARNSVFWPGINRDIETLVKHCQPCQTHQASLAKEPLQAIIPDIPNIPWHTLGTDYFEYENKNYLVIADYYSKFPFVEQMRDMSSKATVNITEKIISTFGIPTQIISDNGGPFIGCAYQNMIQKYSISHVTSSPRYSKSHGFIESQVKIAQNIVKKAKDVPSALLAHRCTPLGHNLPSPAELLFNRKIGGNLPTYVKSSATDADIEKRQVMQQKTATWYDQNAKQLPELCMNQTIFYQDAAKRTWTPGVIIGIGPEPRSYTVKCNVSGRTLRRNRTMIRPRQVTFQAQMSRHIFEPEDAPVSSEPPRAADRNPAVTPEPSTQHTEKPATPATSSPTPDYASSRPQRHKKLPIRYRDPNFVR